MGLDWEVDSAGTSGWHVGEKPDSRSMQVAMSNGIDISRQRSRKFVEVDFADYDYIIAMDSSNYTNIVQMAPTDSDKEKVSLLLNYTHPGQNRQVPDPYYEGGFDTVYQMIYQAVDDLIKQLLSDG